MHVVTLLILALISLLAGALIEPPAVRAAEKSEITTDQTKGQPFRIVAEDLSPATNTRYVAVVLGKRVAEAEITRIAEFARSKEKSPFERTMVNFYLPNMRIGHGAWAVAAFQPGLKVAILGLRLEEEEAAIAEAAVDRRNVIGVWLTSPPAPPGRLTIYRDGGKLMAEWRLRDGSLSRDELVETRDTHGRRLSLASGGTDYYLITANGDLELRDDQAVVATAERLRSLGTDGSSKPVAKVARTASRARSTRSTAKAVAAGDDLSKAIFKD